MPTTPAHPDTSGGRPHRRGTERRAVRYRPGRAAARRRQYEIEHGTATSDAARVTAACDYLRGALRVNPEQITSRELPDITVHLAALVAAADRIYAAATAQANREANTRRSRRTPRRAA